MNYFRTTLLLAALTGLFMTIGFFIGGQSGMVIAFLIALGMNAFSYWNSDKMVLSMHNAQEVDARTAPEYYDTVRQLAANAGLPMPKVYLIQAEQPNAFATGRNPENAAVAATTGLLDRLTRDEVAGVMAHELAHVKNRDTLTMTIAATFGGAISMLANFGMLFGGGNRDGEGRGGGIGIIGTLMMVFLAPLAAGIIQMAISRSREYVADAHGAEICTPAPVARLRAAQDRRAPLNTFPMRTPSGIRPPRICSSSIRSPARAWTACSPPIPIPRTASPNLSGSRGKWGKPLPPLRPAPRRPLEPAAKPRKKVHGGEARGLVSAERARQR